MASKKKKRKKGLGGTLAQYLSTLFIGDQLTGDSEALVFALNVGAILAGVFSALGGILAIAKNFFLPANKK